MRTTPVHIQDVWKRFQRGEQADSLYTLIAARFAHPLQYRARCEASSFWAVESIALNVAAGECVGIIGHNGAGKSTLLKLLAGIMMPTRGTVEVRGRVSALIEVGAGFHPSLTGRENIYLNGSILGMSRSEVRRKFDAIVEFAEIGEHLDSPVKHYSSGMHARLGFSIAVHAEPDVLIVDEVLSVGDHRFRIRCLERMREFLARGVSIVFVSHDLGTVQRFCDRVLVLTKGRASFLGSSGAAIASYRRAHSQMQLLRDAAGRPLIEIRNIRVLDRRENAVTQVSCGETVALEYEIGIRAPVAEPSFGLSIIRASDGLTVFETSSTRQGCRLGSMSAGEWHSVRCRFELNVAPGAYDIGFHVRDRDLLQYFHEDTEGVRLNVTGPRHGRGPAHLPSDLSVALGG